MYVYVCVSVWHGTCQEFVSSSVSGPVLASGSFDCEYSRVFIRQDNLTYHHHFCNRQSSLTVPSVEFRCSNGVLL